MFLDVTRRAFRDHLTAMHAGSRADVQNGVRGADGFFVVFHHEHRVAQVAQVLERTQQARVVALMQPDGRLVEDVHDAGEPRAHLAGQTNALGFTAGQRFGTAIERQIVETHVDEKTQTVTDFLDDLVGDFGAPARDVERLEKQPGVAHRQVRDGGQGMRAHEHIARGAVEARALAVGTGLAAEIFREFLAYRERVGFLVAPLEIGNDALEAMLLLRRATVAVHVTELDFLVAAAEQHDLLGLLREVLPGCLGVELEVPGHGGDEREVVRVLAVPALDGAAGQRQMWIGDHAFRIEEVLEPDSVAGGAGARGAVERKHLWLECGNAVAAFRTGLARGKQRLVFRLADLLRFIGRQARGATGKLERGFQRLRQALLGIRPDAQPVDHGFDGVFLLRVDLRQRIQFMHAAVDARAHESLSAQLFEDFGVLALSIHDHGCQQLYRRALGHLEDLVHHLAHGLRGQGDAMVRATRDARAREQQA